jgi:hypothetical protein
MKNKYYKIEKEKERKIGKKPTCSRFRRRVRIRGGSLLIGGVHHSKTSFNTKSFNDSKSKSSSNDSPPDILPQLNKIKALANSHLWLLDIVKRPSVWYVRWAIFPNIDSINESIVKLFV